MMQKKWLMRQIRHQYRLVPTFDFKQELLSRGATFEVMSPEWFRDEIKEDIAAMAKRYGL